MQNLCRTSVEQLQNCSRINHFFVSSLSLRCLFAVSPLSLPGICFSLSKVWSSLTLLPSGAPARHRPHEECVDRGAASRAMFPEFSECQRRMLTRAACQSLQREFSCQLLGYYCSQILRAVLFHIILYIHTCILFTNKLFGIQNSLMFFFSIEKEEH